MNKIYDIIASTFYIGYLPIASGTFGSLGAVAFIFTIANCININHFWISILGGIITLLLGVISSEKVITYYKEDDPSYIVIDEWCGMFLSFLFIPITFVSCILAFFIFRFFDIVKVWPASIFDKSEGSWAIMLDDVVAGIYTAISMLLIHLLYYYILI